MTYSKDFVKNTIRLYDNKHTYKMSIITILKCQNISRDTLYNWVRKSKIQTIQNKKSNNKKKRVNIKYTPKCISFILDYVGKHKQFEIKKIRKAILNKFKFPISSSSIYYILNRNNITYKKTNEDHYPYSGEKREHQINEVNSMLSKETYNVDTPASFNF